MELFGLGKNQKSTSGTGQKTVAFQSEDSFSFDMEVPYVTASNSTPSGSTSSRYVNYEVIKSVEKVKNQLTKVTRPINLLVVMIYAMLCFNWYLMGYLWYLQSPLITDIECEIKELANQSVKWSSEEKNKITKVSDNSFVRGCYYYDYDYEYLSTLSYEIAEEEVSRIENPGVKMCQKYNITDAVPKEISAVADFDIVCLKKPLHTNTFYLEVGTAFLAFPVGVLADIYGRRPLHIFSSCLFTANCFLIPFTTNYAAFAVEKILMGGGLFLSNILINMLYSEICRSNYRVFTTLMAYAGYFFGVGQPMGNIRMIEVWRLRYTAYAITTIIPLFGAIIFIPESPRYLIMKKQFSKAWTALAELGSKDAKPPETHDYDITYPTVKYQIRILARPYLLHRVYVGIVLITVGIYFYFMFRHLALKASMIGSNIKFTILCLEIILLTGSSALTITFSKKSVICVYYILISLCLMSNMITSGETMRNVSTLAGLVFSETMYIFAYTYLIDIFPTTHRATSIGLCVSLIIMVAMLMEWFHEKLTPRADSDILVTLYCCLAMVCALIAIIGPDTNNEIPDRKYDIIERRTSLDDTLYTDSS